MKKNYLLLFVLLTVFTVQAQDRIVTVKNDTINCRIQSITDTHIRYEQPANGGFVTGKIILLTEVAEYYRKPVSTEIRDKVENPWVLGISTGGGYLPWVMEIIEESVDSENASKIENGYQLNTNAHYLFNPYFGAGLQYSFFTSGYKGDVLTEVNPTYPTYSYAYQRDRQYINYGGLSVLFQQSVGAKKKIQLSETLSTGVLFYRYEYQYYRALPYSSGYSIDMVNGLVEGVTLGASLGLSAGYHLTPKLMIGAGADFLFGMTKKVHVQSKGYNEDYISEDDYTLNIPLNMSRINYSLVLRYTL